MMVLRNHEIRLGGDGAIAKFVVVRVSLNHVEAEFCFDVADVSVKLREQFQQRRDSAPAFRAGKPRDDFLVFEQNFRGNRERETAIQQGAKNRMERLPPGQKFEERRRCRDKRSGVTVFSAKLFHQL